MDVGYPEITRTRPVISGLPVTRPQRGDGSIGGTEVSPTQPASGLNVLFLFQGQGVDVCGRDVAMYQRCVGGIQPKPQAESSGKRKGSLKERRFLRPFD